LLLFGTREDIIRSSDYFSRFCGKMKENVEGETEPTLYSQGFGAEQVALCRHIPNYPEAIDQMTRL